MNEAVEYATSGLISYIGNKRRILPQIAEEIAPLIRRPGATTLLDPFCGSGAVARVARHLGCVVAANDSEAYASAVTAPYLENQADDLDVIFAAYGGIASVYDHLNECVTPREPYISRHYAPADTAAPRLGRERLFYTAENARFLDAVREEIERMFPAGVEGHGGRARRVVLASLLHQASVHANTSGVFKAYHRGFGGLGEDALGRILGAMRLVPPVIGPGPIGTVSTGDAAEFVGGRAADICYVDPPYATHQYGSNYFMLTTLLLWDRPEVDERRDDAGDLVAKAGIRPDWRRTRSAYCSRRTAVSALASLLERTDARHLIVSYSSDGLIPLGELAELLSSHGELEVRTIDYTTYRGGRQSISRRSRNGEYLFVVDRHGSRGRAGTSGVPERVTTALAGARVRELAARRFDPILIDQSFVRTDAGVELADGWHARTSDGYELEVGTPPPGVGAEELEDVERRLRRCLIEDSAAEMRILVQLAVGHAGGRTYLRRIPVVLKRFAHRKYRREFDEACALFARALLIYPRLLAPVLPAVNEVIGRARLRSASHGAGSGATRVAR